ncbi:MAG: NAD(P)-dependent oxidoreductase [Burkholderiales bacterium]
MAQGVGVIGLGVIGKPIAERILGAGHPLAVHDIRPEPLVELGRWGAVVCATPAQVAERSDLVISLVVDETQTHEVLFGAHGIVQSVRPGTVIAIGSTLGPLPLRRMGSALHGHGCDTIDMPISGGYIAAREGKLSLMVGATPPVLERALPVLRAFANVVIHAGDIGAGQAAKLAHQLVLTINAMALLEGLSLGAAAGVDPAVLKRIMQSGLAGSTVLQVWEELGPRWKTMFEATPPGVTPPNLRKDLHTALALGHQLGVPLFLGTQASLIADSGIATGHDNPAL